MLKWFSKLSREEILQLHKEVIYDDVLDTFSVNYITGMCTFDEHWKSGYIPTSYEYDDFGVHAWDYWGGASEENKRYIRWMTKKFGVPYLVDLLAYHTGVESVFFSNYLETGAEKRSEDG